MSIITRRRVLQAAAGAIALGLTAMLSGCVGGAAQPASDASGATTLHLVGFAVPKEANNAIQKKFAETPEGEGVVWQESYGASGDQSRAVANGLKADYVNFSLEGDVLAFGFASFSTAPGFSIISLLLVRYTFPGRRALSAMIDVPLSVSPIVVGLALLLVYSGRTGWIGGALESAGLQVIYAPPGMIMATAFVSLPLVIRELVPVLTEIGTDAEQAARSLGASPLQAFLNITLPAIKWALQYGVVLSLARSLGEFGAVKIVSGGVAMRTQTATLLVEERYQQFGPENTITAYTAALILALIAVLALVVVTSLRPKENPR